MEEEYRMQKSHADLHSATQGDGDGHVVIHEDGTVVRAPTLSAGGADDDASTRGVHSPNESGTSDGFGAVSGIPIIKVSTESDIERELAAAANGEGQHGNGVQRENGHEVTSPPLERPVVAAAAVAVTDQDAPDTPRTGQDAFSFTNKRLCERWLDNLFMVLYEVGRSHRVLSWLT